MILSTRARPRTEPAVRLRGFAIAWALSPAAAIERSRPSSSGVQGPCTGVSVISPSAVKEVFECSLCKPPSEYCCYQHAGKNAKHGENVAIRHLPLAFGRRAKVSFKLSAFRITEGMVRFSDFAIDCALTPSPAKSLSRRMSSSVHGRPSVISSP